MSAVHALFGDAFDDKPSASVVFVTPQMAERWLARNVKNRPEKPKSIERFARDMAAGKWQITGEAIKFSVTGDLLDGQNRLRAVVVSGATVPLFVVRGLAPESQEVMDSGMARSVADALGLKSISNGKDVAPAASALMAWRDGFYRHCMVNSSPGYTKSEIHEFIVENPTLPEVTAWAKRVQRQVPLPVGALAACAYRFTTIDADASAAFFDRILELHTYGKGDPVATLVKRVAEDRSRRRRLWVATGLYYVTRAWNADRDGEPLLKFQIGSAETKWASIPEPF